MQDKTTDTITFDFLLPKTKEVLRELSLLVEMENYVFVGGSALSCYLQHRLSEDLDFFTRKPVVDAAQLLPFFNREHLKVLNRSDEQMDLLYKGVKITFFANKWNELSSSRIPLLGHIWIASCGLLAVMKVNTLFMRAKFRDYYDLYFVVNKRFTIAELYELSVPLLPGLTKRLFQTAFTFTDDIVDDRIGHLSPVELVTKKEVAAFFLWKIKEWNKLI